MIQKIWKQQFFKDSFWTMLALCIFNVILQFVVYPFLNRTLGTEEYGNILFLLSVINIVAISIGISANNRRMVASSFSKTSNAEYNLFIGIISVFFLPLCFLISNIFHTGQGIVDIFLFWILMCLTTWRYYSDVEFRLNLNYRGYFLYYLLIGVGYLAGIFLFRCFNQWELILIPGEMMGIFYVLCKGSIYKKTDLNKEKLVIFLKAVAYLIASQLLIQIVFNSDRFILKLFSGGVAVTIYYIASLMGKTIALLSTPLNSVIIGYLAKSKEEMTVNRWIKIVVLCIFLAGTALIACIVASNFVIRILYPQEYSLAKPFFVVANLAQIIYFSTGILATILLRYVEEKYQLYITVGYIFAFLAVVIPVTWMCGLEGFAYAILGVNCLRFVFVFLVMMRKIYRTKS